MHSRRTFGRREASAAGLNIDEAALRLLIETCEAVRREAGAGDAGIDLATLLTLPGVLRVPDTQDLLEQSRPVVLDLAEKACDKLMAMRRVEGESLVHDLRGQCDVIRSNLERVADRAPHVVEEYHQRLRARIDQLLARAELQMAQHDLIREVAIFAERSDVSEEVQRLGAHLEQFEAILGREDDEPAGRTLDFIAQELLREANTIASKSNDASIGRWVVEIKGAVDRIKEQVQNVE